MKKLILLLLLLPTIAFAQVDTLTKSDAIWPTWMNKINRSMLDTNYWRLVGAYQSSGYVPEHMYSVIGSTIISDLLLASHGASNIFLNSQLSEDQLNDILKGKRNNTNIIGGNVYAKTASGKLPNKVFNAIGLYGLGHNTNPMTSSTVTIDSANYNTLVQTISEVPDFIIKNQDSSVFINVTGDAVYKGFNQTNRGSKNVIINAHDEFNFGIPNNAKFSRSDISKNNIIMNSTEGGTSVSGANNFIFGNAWVLGDNNLVVDLTGANDNTISRLGANFYARGSSNILIGNVNRYGDVGSNFLREDWKDVDNTPMVDQLIVAVGFDQYIPRMEGMNFGNSNRTEGAFSFTIGRGAITDNAGELGFMVTNRADIISDNHFGRKNSWAYMFHEAIPAGQTDTVHIMGNQGADIEGWNKYTELFTASLHKIKAHVLAYGNHAKKAAAWEINMVIRVIPPSPGDNSIDSVKIESIEKILLYSDGDMDITPVAIKASPYSAYLLWMATGDSSVDTRWMIKMEDVALLRKW